jgi:hypothetical protein
VLDDHHLVEVRQGRAPQERRPAKAVSNGTQRQPEPGQGLLEGLRSGGRRETGGDELANEALAIGRVLLVLDERLRQEQPAEHVLPGITHDRELARTIVSLPHTDPAQLCEDLLREPFAGGRRPGQPLNDAHMG